ncbi:MAG: hypothetical protein ACLFV8_14965 [Alphaproteobacteria bacterium]
MTAAEGEEIIIARRFNGPPDSGNGGYVCGRLAAFVDSTAQVTLRRPPPLETPLDITRDGVCVRLSREGELIAEAEPAPLELDVPRAPSLAEAEAAVPGFPGFENHELPTCFVCGTEREAGDGLCIHPGPVARRDDGLLACPWTPAPGLADPQGLVRAEFLWSALDCPGAFAVQWAEQGALCLLGRLTARLDERPRAGARLIVAGWPIGRDGRKRFAGTAVYTEEGRPIARASAVWIELKQPPA